MVDKMKTNVPGLIITAILAFNILCLLIYFLLKFLRHDRRINEKDCDNT